MGEDAKRWWYVWVDGGPAMEVQAASEFEAASFYMHNQSIRTTYVSEEVIMVIELAAVRRFGLRVALDPADEIGENFPLSEGAWPA